MDRSEQIKFSPTSVAHPGDMVVEYLDFNGWSQSDLARRTGLTPKTISEICNRKSPVTPNTALMLERAFQRPAQFWLNLQRQFDEAEARQRERSRAKGWDEWAATFPLKEMKKLGFTIPTRSSEAETLLSYFGVASPDRLEMVMQSTPAAFRQSRTLSPLDLSVAAWVRQTEIEANKRTVDSFDAEKLMTSLDDLRGLTRIKADQILEPLQRICEMAGLIVVIVPALKNTGISGCARWLNGHKPLVALTLRYKTDDQFWFTFFHEIGHVILHKNKHPFVIDNAVDDLSDRVIDPEMEIYELEANRFAANVLVPPLSFNEFVHGNVFTSESIYNFAESIGVGPGIVVGRLQYEGILKPYQGNKFKQKIGWKIER